VKDADTVSVEKVVSDVKLIPVQRDLETSPCWREIFWWPNEGDEGGGSEPGLLAMLRAIELDRGDSQMKGLSAYRKVW
jgi:hypothetical protein